MEKWHIYFYFTKKLLTQNSLILALLCFQLSIFRINYGLADKVHLGRKDWFPCLQHPLQSVLDVRGQQRDVSYFYDLISVEIAKLVRWCTLTTNFPLVNHLTHWLPCGYAHFSSIWIQKSFRLEIKTHTIFILVINFTHFKMDDSGPKCSNSLIALGTKIRDKWIFPKPWRFCGQRKPWYEVALSYKVSLAVRVVNLRQPFYITFDYVAVDHSRADWLRMKSRMQHIIYGSRDNLLFHYRSDGSKVGVMFHNWLITVAPGSVIEYLSSTTCCFIGFLDIFDGPEMLHRLLRFDKKNITNVEDNDIMLMTSYMKSYIRLQFNESHRYPRKITVFIIRTRRAVCQYIELDTPSVTRVKHGSLILYKMFLLKSSNHKFPNISLTIRKFEGLNEGGCNFGGYAIRQNISHELLGPNLFGPYCTGVTSNTPLIDGLMHLILDDKQTFLIFYAFGPYYQIDVDILIIESECEGIIDPQNFCLPKQQQQEAETDDVLMIYLTGRNYILRCVQIVMNYIMINLLRNCVSIQFITHMAVTSYSLEIEGHMQLQFYFWRSTYFEDNITLLFVDELMHSRQISPVARKPISRDRLKYFRLWHYFSSPYDYVSYMLRLDIIKLQSKCATFDELSHVIRNLFEETLLMLPITSNCGYGTYSKPSLYLYAYKIWKSQKQNQKSVIYMVVKRIGCIESPENFDVVTMVFRGFVHHSVDVIGNKTLHLRYRDLTVNLIYNKISSCSVYELQYRIETLQILKSLNTIWINVYQRTVRYFNICKTFS